MIISRRDRKVSRQKRQSVFVLSIRGLKPHSKRAFPVTIDCDTSPWAQLIVWINRECRKSEKFHKKMNHVRVASSDCVTSLDHKLIFPIIAQNALEIVSDQNHYQHSSPPHHWWTPPKYGRPKPFLSRHFPSQIDSLSSKLLHSSTRADVVNEWNIKWDT